MDNQNGNRMRLSLMIQFAVLLGILWLFLRYWERSPEDSLGLALFIIVFLGQLILVSYNAVRFRQNKSGES